MKKNAQLDVRTCKFMHSYYAFYAFISINMIINACYCCLKMTKRIFLIFHDLITIYEHFMPLLH